MKVRDIPTHWMNSWINVCIETDTTAGNISVLVNENPPLLFDVPDLTIQPPENLKESLYIGLFEDNLGRRQFQGEVANFNIFSGKHLIERDCDDPGDIVNKDTEWKRVGSVTEKTEESWKICTNNDFL